MASERDEAPRLRPGSSRALVGVAMFPGLHHLSIVLIWFVASVGTVVAADGCALMDEMSALIENAALDTRVAWVRDLLDRLTVDGREEHVVAIWRTAFDDAVISDSVSSWLRR